MHSIVNNHAFFNGNKRTGLVSLLVLLDRSGLTLTCSQDELFRWTVRIAQHKLPGTYLRGDRNDIEVVRMAEWIRDNSRFIDKGERVITWADFRRRLVHFDCRIQSSGSGGGKMVISRDVRVVAPGRFGSRTKTVQRKFVLRYGGDGRQVSRQSIKALRAALELSEEYGIDSANFYGYDTSPTDEFIGKYRKTLTRLAKT